MEDSLCVTALGVWSARRRRAASLSGVPKTPDLPRSAVPVSDSCLAQVPPVTTPQSTRNTAFAILLPPGLGVLEMGCPGCALSFVLFSAKPLKAPSGFTSRFCSYTW